MLNHYTLINLRSISQSLGAVLIIHAAMYEVGLRLLVKLDTLTRFGFHDNCFKLRTGVTTTTTIVVVRTQYCNDTLFGFGEFGNFQTAFYIGTAGKAATVIGLTELFEQSGVTLGLLLTICRAAFLTK